MARTLLEPAPFVLRPDPRWPRLLRTSLLLPPLLVASWLLWHQVQVGAGLPPVLPLVAALLAMGAQLVLVRRMLRESVPGQTLCLRPPAPGVPVWHVDRQPGEPVCHIDAGDWLLLRITLRAERPRWLALARRDQPDEWHRLRCALQARPAAMAPSPSSPTPLPPAER
ncbi:hypothetical protein X805_21920 [Sphaerotilus natans subsp. natans DSM 6575]|uniref:Toxin CptA n=1 Tax=Sphaerotilus natans subsp. natans DSM 6575 TaxID=1286631 RepID=A0A059KLX3_9BURK|nr:hypothetical protein [Sphaerotilus natans]KDB52214.1 hypothetical protein X805_21920 [Sphaerotilus natans subsp. natans DSM 6575]SIR63415.1 hypothetical protein SAMN05421778_113114 [Sphaerotilus natans]